MKEPLLAEILKHLDIMLFDLYQLCFLFQLLIVYLNIVYKKCIYVFVIGRTFFYLLKNTDSNSNRLTKHLLTEYLKGFTYYKITNLDNRIANADQVIAQDVDRFCQSVSDLYSNISKPILDICIYAVKLTGAIGRIYFDCK